jgi:hypothetical protein
LDDYSVVVCKQATLKIPLLHLLIKYFVRFAVDEILHNLLPLFQIQLASLEEGVKIEEVNYFSSVGLKKARINLVRPLNN